MVYISRLIALAVFLNVIMAAIAYMSLNTSRLHHEEFATTATRNLSELVTHDIGSDFDRADQALLVVADEYARQAAQGRLDTPALNELIGRQLSRHPELLALRISNNDGDLILGSDDASPEPKNVIEAEYFIKHRNDPRSGLIISESAPGRISGKLGIILARRLNSRDGKFAGVVYCKLGLDYLESKLAGLRPGRNGSIALRNDKLGLIVRSPRLEGVAGEAGSTKISEDFRLALQHNPLAGSYSGGAAGIDRWSGLHGFRKHAHYPFYVDVGMARDDFLGEWRSEVRMMLAIVMVFVLMTVVGTWFLLRAWRRRERAVKELTDSETRFRGMLEASPTACGLIEKHGNITYLNPAFVRIFGYTLEDIPTMEDWWRNAYPDPRYRQWVTDAWSSRLEDHSGKRMGFEPVEVSVRCKGGETRVVVGATSPLDGLFDGALVATLYDITDRKSAEEQLRLAALVYQTIKEAMIVADADNRIISVNPAFTALTGYTAEEAIGQTTSLLKSGRQSAAFYQEMWRALNTTGHWQGEILNRRKDGQVYAEWLNISTFYDEHHAVLRRVAMFSDITERKRIESMLLQRKTELQELYAALQTVREEERRRFARELHDDLGQRMTALRIDLDWLEARLPRAEPPVSDKLATINIEVDQIVDSIRRISEDLRPGMLDTLGMNAAIENFVQKFSARSGIPCELSMSHDEFEVDDKVATSIFRLLQEALNNILKHAAATRISIIVRCSDESVELVVEDNGIGLSDLDAAGRSGFGLPGMRERVSILDGRFTLTSQAGRGVRIAVVIPTRQR